MIGVIFARGKSKRTNYASAEALDALVLQRAKAAGRRGSGATSYAAPVPHPNAEDRRVLYELDDFAAHVAREQGFRIVEVQDPGPFHPPPPEGPPPGRPR